MRPRFGNSKSYDIAFYCRSIPFSKEVIELKTSLGGSETALIQLARELSLRGHCVTIFTDLTPDTQPGEDDYGVLWLRENDLFEVLRAREPDVFCSLRMPDIFAQETFRRPDGQSLTMRRPHNLPAKLRVEWNQDLLAQPDWYAAQTFSVDMHVFVSEYHKGQYCRQIPFLEPFSWAAFNPVDLSLVDASIGDMLDPKGLTDWKYKKPNQLLHVARPERSLNTTVQIFEKLRQKHPDLELKVCRYYSMYEPNPQVAAICQQADAVIANTEGAEFLGNLDKVTLYRTMAESALILYPGVPDFAETACIAALEAQACGTPMIATKIGALPETLDSRAGRLIEGNAYSPEYQEAFCKAAEHLLIDRFSYHLCQEAGRKHVRKFDTPRLADAWEEKIESLFVERFERHRRKIFDNLMWHEDVRGARELANAHAPEWVAEVDGWVEANPPSPEHFFAASIPTAHEIKMNPRVNAVIRVLKDMKNLAPTRILDFACGNGSFSTVLAQAFPDATVTLVDYAQPLLDKAKAHLTETFGMEAVESRFRFFCGSLEDLEALGTFDLVYCGEFLEHSEHPEDTLSVFESVLESDGWMAVTTPYGPFGEGIYALNEDPAKHERAHRYHFEYRDWEDLVGHRQGADILYTPMPDSPRGSLHGHWIVVYQQDGGQVGKVDYERKTVRFRPRFTLSVCMVTRNEQANLLRALDTVKFIADELWVADTGSDDQTLPMLREWAKQNVHVKEIGVCPFAPETLPSPRHFGWARDRSVEEATGDWIFWIDADEVLDNPHILRKYMVENGFEGYVVKQNHLMFNVPQRADTPIRLFRNGKGYNCADQPIHEHFFMRTNQPIEPALLAEDIAIVHFGYWNELTRRGKCAWRNLPILRWAMEKYPDRVMNRPLYARDCLNVVKWNLESTHGQMNEAAAYHLREAMTILDNPLFLEPESMWFAVSFPIWQEALSFLGPQVLRMTVMEFDRETLSVQGKERMFRSPQEFQRYADFRAKEISERLRPGPKL